MNLLRPFWKWWLARNGWTIVGGIPPGVRKAVLAVAPHTSSADFFLGLAVRSVMPLKHARFLGKKELFRPPFGFLFRWLGGTPVDRSGRHNVVEQVARMFRETDDFMIALSPEGTRKRVDRLRTGFYHIALMAQVPIIMVAFDFAHRRVVFAEPFMPSGREEEDFKKIIAFFSPIQGKVPGKGLEHFSAAAPGSTTGAA